MQFKKITSYIDLFLDLHATVFLSTGDLCLVDIDSIQVTVLDLFYL